MATNEATSWLLLIAFGGMAGAIGQAIRLILGIRKQMLTSTGKGLTPPLDPTRIITTLLIGFLAGVLAAILVVRDLHRIAADQIFALIAAGYAGADSIEGFLARALPRAATDEGAPR